LLQHKILRENSKQVGIKITPWHSSQRYSLSAHQFQGLQTQNSLIGLSVI